VKIADGRMVVELATDVLFDSGSAKLSPAGKEAIMEVSRVLVTIADRQFQVEGHTDNVPIATAQYPSNWELAAARSMTVVKSMIEAGMTPARISAASYGDTRPVAGNDTPDGKAATRRIEIVGVPDLSELPGFEELSKAGSN
jgi:chemotaxis protein MotB